MVGIAAAAASAVGGIAGAIGGSQNSGGSSQTSSNAPWSAEQPYMQNGYNQAAAIEAQRMGQAAPTQFIAGENGMQTSANQSIYNTGMGAASQFSPWSQAGSLLAGNAGAYSNNANSIASNGIGSLDPSMTNLMSNYAATGQMPNQTGADPNVANSISSAATQGLGSLGQAQGIANNVANGQNTAQQAQQTAQNAGQYVNNDILNGQINAVGTDINRNLSQTTIPGIQAAAQATGSVNSSREGALEGIADVGANENLANASANLRGAAYNNGVNVAAAQTQNANTNQLNAANVLNTNGSTAGSLATSQQALQQQNGQFNTTSQLGAAQNVNSDNLAYQTANTQAQLAGNAQLGTGLTTGMAASNTGLAGTLAGETAAQGAGSYQQNQDQLAINQNLAAYNAADTRDQGVLNDYWNIVGKPTGSSGSQTTTPNNGGIGGAVSGGVGGAMAGYGLYNNLTGGSTTPAANTDGTANGAQSWANWTQT